MIARRINNNRVWQLKVNNTMKHRDWSPKAMLYCNQIGKLSSGIDFSLWKIWLFSWIGTWAGVIFVLNHQESKLSLWTKFSYWLWANINVNIMVERANVFMTSICWICIWLTLLFWVAFPLAGVCAPLYIALSPFGVFIKPLAKLSGLLLKGVELPETLAKNIKQRKSLSWKIHRNITSSHRINADSQQVRKTNTEQT